MSSTLTAYRTAPQMEFKAAQELRDAGIRAYVPRDRTATRKTPIARGYVFSRYKPAFAKHVKSRVGDLPSTDLARIYQQRKAAEAQARFAVGEVVRIKIGAFADLMGRIEGPAKRGWMVRTLMLGKDCVTYVRDSYVYRATRDG